MQIPQLTFTRFLAGVSIVILHYGLYTWPISTHLVFPIMGKSISAVSYFFILSGFILVVSSAKGGNLIPKVDSSTFWKKRAARILPIYIFSVLLFFAINFRYDPSIPLEWQTQSYYYSFFLLQAWKYKMVLDINYPAWTLSVEIFFYFIFPWVYSNLVALSTKKLIIISIIAWWGNTYIYQCLLEENAPHNFAMYYPLFHVATFITGMCSGIIFVKNYAWLSGKGRNYLLAVSGFTLLFMIYTAYKNWDFYNYSHNGYLSPFFVLMFFSLSVMKGPVVNLLSTKPFVFLGDISYSIYLFQYPVLQICQKYLPWFKGKESKDFFPPYLIILIAFSAVIYLTIEKPARNFFAKKIKQPSLNAV